jgi:hypothetical protein
LAVVPQDQGAFSLSPSLDVEPIVLEKEYNTRDRNDIFEMVMEIKSSIHVGSRRLDAGRPVYSFAERRRSRLWSLFLRCWTQEPRYANHGCSANSSVWIPMCSQPCDGSLFRPLFPRHDLQQSSAVVVSRGARRAHAWYQD